MPDDRSQSWPARRKDHAFQEPAAERAITLGVRQANDAASDNSLRGVRQWTRSATECGALRSKRLGYFTNAIAELPGTCTALQPGFGSGTKMDAAPLSDISVR